MKEIIEDIDFGKMNGIIPVVTIDKRSKKVLMIGFMNKESLAKTLETNEMYYYSRTRNKIWKKGETSGNTQRLLSLKIDCDNDALLAEVEQQGVVCHEGKNSCFSNEIIPGMEDRNTERDILNELSGVIRARKTDPKEGSYVCRLMNGEVRVDEKLTEEVDELIRANKEEEIIWEAADLLFFILIYLEKKGVDYRKVLKELKRRRDR